MNEMHTLVLKNRIGFKFCSQAEEKLDATLFQVHQEVRKDASPF